MQNIRAWFSPNTATQLTFITEFRLVSLHKPLSRPYMPLISIPSEGKPTSSPCPLENHMPRFSSPQVRLELQSPSLSQSTELITPAGVASLVWGTQKPFLGSLRNDYKHFHIK